MEYLPSNVFARVAAASDLIGADCVMPLSVDSIGMRFNRSAVAVIVEGKQVPILNCRWNTHDSSLLVEAAYWQSHAASAGCVFWSRATAGRFMAAGMLIACLRGLTLELSWHQRWDAQAQSGENVPRTARLGLRGPPLVLNLSDGLGRTALS